MSTIPPDPNRPDDVSSSPAPDAADNPHARTPPARPFDPATLPARPSSWPTVLGVILIVVGALGTLAGAWGLFMNSGEAAFPAELDEAMRKALEAQIELQQSLTMRLLMVAGFGLNLLLLCVGVGMVQRLRWSVSLAKAWAVLYLTLTVVSTALTLPAQMEMQREVSIAATSAAGPGAAGMGELMTGIMYVATGCGIAFALFLPIFILIWLRRAKIKAEIEAWG